MLVRSSPPRSDPEQWASYHGCSDFLLNKIQKETTESKKVGWILIQVIFESNVDWSNANPTKDYFKTKLGHDTLVKTTVEDAYIHV